MTWLCSFFSVSDLFSPLMVSRSFDKVTSTVLLVHAGKLGRDDDLLVGFADLQGQGDQAVPGTTTEPMQAPSARIAEEIEASLGPANEGLVRVPISALDAVDGSRHRHRDVPHCGCS